jgi:hypothetical protein
MAENTQLVLVVGKSSAGKSASLRNLLNPEGVMYLNCESGKRLPFAAKFIKGADGTAGVKITDPMHVYHAFDQAEQMPEVHTIVVDTLTYLMNMYESMYVNTAADTRAAWGSYAQFFKTLMQDKVAKSSKRVIFLAHSKDEVNDDKVREVVVPVKGALKNEGIESYFSMVIASKTFSVDELEGHKNALLTFNEEDEDVAQGYKYVFQVRKTKDTVNERLRGPMGMWAANETYIDNDIQHVLDRLHEYYAA